MDDYKDIDNYDENVSEIRGEPKYFSTNQVGEILGEAPSTIRYWSDQYEDFLEIKKTGPSGRVRRFTNDDIVKIEYIRKLLKEENLSIKQVKEYLSSDNAKELQPVTKEREEVLIDALANVVFEKMDDRFSEMLQSMERLIANKAETYVEEQDKLKLDLMNHISGSQQSIAEDMKASILEEVQKSMLQTNDQIDKIVESSNERSEKLDSYIEEVRKSQEKPTEEGKQGFFSKLFGKKG